MSQIIKRSTVGIATCPKSHEHGECTVKLSYSHGECTVKLSYSTSNPLTFNLHTRVSFDGNESRISAEVYREAVYYWIMQAPAGSVLELGELSLKVRLSAPFVVTVKFPPVQIAGRLLNPMVMVSRDWLVKALTDTYVAVPAEAECDHLDVDACIEQILNAK